MAASDVLKALAMIMQENREDRRLQQTLNYRMMEQKIANDLNIATEIYKSAKDDAKLAEKEYKTAYAALSKTNFDLGKLNEMYTSGNADKINNQIQGSNVEQLATLANNYNTKADNYEMKTEAIYEVLNEIVTPANQIIAGGAGPEGGLVEGEWDIGDLGFESYLEQNNLKGASEEIMLNEAAIQDYQQEIDNIEEGWIDETRQIVDVDNDGNYVTIAGNRNTAISDMEDSSGLEYQALKSKVAELGAANQTLEEQIKHLPLIEDYFARSSGVQRQELDKLVKGVAALDLTEKKTDYYGQQEDLVKEKGAQQKKNNIRSYLTTTMKGMGVNTKFNETILNLARLNDPTNELPQSPGETDEAYNQRITLYAQDANKQKAMIAKDILFLKGDTAEKSDPKLKTKLADAWDDYHNMFTNARVNYQTGGMGTGDADFSGYINLLDEAFKAFNTKFKGSSDQELFYSLAQKYLGFDTGKFADFDQFVNHMKFQEAEFSLVQIGGNASSDGSDDGNTGSLDALDDLEMEQILNNVRGND